MENVTIKDIARLAGVSLATVSRTLNGSSRVDPVTRERILDLCRQHGYRPNLLARNLSASRTGLIGCILSNMDNPFFAEMSLLLEQSARRHDCRMLLCHGRVEDADMEQVLDFLIGHRVDGIILVSSSLQAPALIRRYMDRVPILLQGSLQPEPDAPAPIPFVSIDDRAGGRMAAEHLYGLGHRSVAYLGLRPNNSSQLFRLQGFSETAQQLGMSVRVLSHDGTASGTAAGYHLARRFFFEDFPETAVFASCDAVALGVLSAAAEFHISIPEDLSLVGFDNIRYASLPNIHLTTIDHHAAQVVEAAVTQLLALVNQEESAASLMIAPTLISRATCRPLDNCCRT